MIKNIKLWFLKRHNSLIGFGLSILGVSAACSISSCEYGAPAVEYGVPHATFVVKGTVVSDQDSTPIQSIRVVLEHDTAYTDPSGQYRVEHSSFPDSQTLMVQFEDTDGEINGSFNARDTIVEFTDPLFSGGSGSWDAGTTEKEVDVELKPKK